MPEATMKPKETQQVVPAQNAFNRYFFAFSNACTKSCADDQFGARNLSSPGESLFATPAAADTFSKTIVTYIAPMVDEDDVSQYLQINYEAADIQAAVMRANSPMVRVIFHRLGCACCGDMSRALYRIEMIADTVADVESGNHRSKPGSNDTQWIKYIDRAWLEQILYFHDLGEDGSSSESKEHDKTGYDYAGMREMFTQRGATRTRSVAIVLADVANASWIINSKPFPTVEQQPRTGQMFGLQKDIYHPTDFSRTFLGTFATIGALKRRRADSPPSEAGRVTNKRKGRSSNHSTMKQTQPDYAYPPFQEIGTSHLTLTGYDEIWHSQVLRDVGTIYALAFSASKIKGNNLKILAALASKESKRRREKSGKGAKGLRVRAKNVMRDMVEFWKPFEHDERIRRKVAERQDRLKAYMAEFGLDQEVIQVNRAESSIRGDAAEALGDSAGCNVELPREVEAQPESGSSHRNEAQMQEREDGTPMQWQWCPLRREPTEICLVEHTDDSTHDSRQITFLWPARGRKEKSTYPTHEPTFRKWLESIIAGKFHIPGPEQYIEVKHINMGVWMHADDWNYIHSWIGRSCSYETPWTIRVSRNSKTSCGSMAVLSDSYQLQEQPTSGVDEEDGTVARHEQDDMNVSDLETMFVTSDSESDEGLIYGGSDEETEHESDLDYEEGVSPISFWEPKPKRSRWRQ
ncbi:putative DNA helicase ino80 [Gnomoniopsis sp. IMI 355080]|nr:putative DNA helicase ino80 [Gnomoniopsis sp. IMI 355080]